MHSIYDNNDRNSTQEDDFIQKISRIKEYSSQSKLNIQDRFQYQRLMVEFDPLFKRCLRELGLDKTEENMQEARLKFLETITGEKAIQFSDFIIKTRIKDHLIKKNKKKNYKQYKTVFQDWQDQSIDNQEIEQREERFNKMKHSLTDTEKNIIEFALTLNRDKVCEKMQITKYEYDSIMKSIKQKLAF